MAFDFYELFRNYSTPELLAITNKPGDYQPEALAAARKLLAQRAVTAADQQEARELVTKSVSNSNLAIQAAKNKASEFLKTVTTHEAAGGLPKWHKVLLFFLAISLCMDLYRAWQLVKMFSPACKYCRFGMGEYLALFTAALGILLLYLVYKRKRWGWVLLFANLLISVLLSVTNFILFAGKSYAAGAFGSNWIFQLLLMLGLLIYLWQERTAAYFNINPKARNNTLSITLFLTAGLIIVLLGFL